MVLEYFTLKRGSKVNEHESDDQDVIKTPILNDEEEHFLERVTSQGRSPISTDRMPPPNSDRLGEGKDAQVALMDGANEIPLPVSPLAEGDHKIEAARPHQKSGTIQEKRQKYWSNISTMVREKTKFNTKKGKLDKKSSKGVDSKKTIEETGKTQAIEEEKQEEDDLSKVLDQLNLAAVNNRVFSFSKESQELLDKFKLVLKDLINGVPTAYDDLEKLLTNSEGQIQKLYGGLPPFLQTLVKGLPSKMTAALGPEILAAASEKPGADAAKLDTNTKLNTNKTSKRKTKTPSLKSLVSEQGVVASMLRSILHFLKLRFPVLMTGTNVLMSLAVFLLLFVFWYCHKRGKETRLSRERLSAEASDSEGSSIAESSQIADPITSQKSTGDGKSLTRDGTASSMPNSAKEEIKLPSVLDLPEPKMIPLPGDKDEEVNKSAC